VALGSRREELRDLRLGKAGCGTGSLLVNVWTENGKLTERHRHADAVSLIQQKSANKKTGRWGRDGIAGSGEYVRKLEEGTVRRRRTCGGGEGGGSDESGATKLARGDKQREEEKNISFNR